MLFFLCSGIDFSNTSDWKDDINLLLLLLFEVVVVVVVVFVV